MRIVEARVESFERRSRRSLTIAHGALARRPGVRLCLLDSGGNPGIGEASPLVHFGGEGVAEARDSLTRAARDLQGRELDSPTRRLAALELSHKLGTGARWALDCALHDLFARERGVRVADLLSRSSPREFLELSLLLDADEPLSLARQGRRAAALGFQTLKLKIGRSPDPTGGAADLDRVAALREAVGKGARIRLDANEAWSRDEAERQLASLARYSPELIEQPVARDEVEALASLRRAQRIPIAADESVLEPDRLWRVLEADAADVVVLKPAALGGLERSLRVAARVRSAGPRLIVTSLLDGPVSTAGALAVAASLPERPLACGLVTAEALERAPATAPGIQRGWIALSSTPGLGVRIWR